MDADDLRELLTKLWDMSPVPLEPGEMSPRERFFATMEFRKPDRIIDTEFGYWSDTLRRWHGEGLPAFVDDNGKADAFFGFDKWNVGLGISNFLEPYFEHELVEEAGEYRIEYDGHRVKQKVFKNGQDTIPHYLDFPIKDRESYLPFKERLAPMLDKRFPKNWERIVGQAKDRNYVLSYWGGSTMGWIRNLMGFEGVALACYEQPELLREILDDLRALQTSILEKVTQETTFDLVALWEDIAFKNGPIIPPKFFYENAGPVYGAIMHAAERAGCRYAFVDCDGDMRKLVPTWLDHGVNIMFPLEVAAGIHPEQLRRDFPQIRMMGGFDKVQLIKGPQAIKAELLRLEPLVTEGGFIPHVDHRVQADVPYRNYLYYLEAKRDIFGLPGKVAA
jgi:uroporphyrinogen decarboxylase